MPNMLDEIVCAEDCTDTEILPVVSFDDCNPEINKSEIIAIYAAGPDAIAFADFSDPEEWADRLSQTGTPPTGSTVAAKDLIRRLTVIADEPAPTDVTRAISNNRTQILDRTRVINVTIDEVNDANYDFARSTECGGGLKGKFWYETAGGYLYGGSNGLKAGPGGQAPTLRLSPVKERGTDSVETLAGTISWSNLKSAARVKSPFA